MLLYNCSFIGHDQNFFEMTEKSFLSECLKILGNEHCYSKFYYNCEKMTKMSQ